MAFENLSTWMNERKRLLIISSLIIAVFFFFWIFNLGSFASFFAVYSWSIDRAEQELGLNPYLIRGILVPLVALFVYALSLTFNLLSGTKRVIGRFLLILILTGISFALYFYTEQIYTSEALFNPYTGQPLKRYYKKGVEVEYFPSTTRFHPKTGEKLALIDKYLTEQMKQDEEIIQSATEKANQIVNNATKQADEILKNAEEEAQNFENKYSKNRRVVTIRGDQTWQHTAFEVNKGEKIEISATGYVYANSDVRIGPDGYHNNEYWIEEYNVVGNIGHCALIAQILPRGKPFFVGKHYEFVADETGEILVGINDSDTKNNKGEFTAIIKRIN